MAQFPRVNGDLLPVAVYDAQSYVNTGTNAVLSGATVQPQGPKLQFFTVTPGGALTGDQVATVVQTVQQLATIYMYEYNDNGGSADSLAMALYPMDAWTTASMAAAVDTALAVTTTAVTLSATFTN